MNIYLISRKGCCGYDEYDAFVVRAETTKQARVIAAKSASYVYGDEDPMEDDEYRLWMTPEGSSVETLATDVKGKAEEILGSYNAG